jgi:hypothetical protein
MAMSIQRARRTAALSALSLALATSIAAAHDAKHWQRDDESAERKESAEAARPTTHNEHHVYFRPFCRRARYVTSRSAACWE